MKVGLPRLIRAILGVLGKRGARLEKVSVGGYFRSCHSIHPGSEEIPYGQHKLTELIIPLRVDVVVMTDGINMGTWYDVRRSMLRVVDVWATMGIALLPKVVGFDINWTQEARTLNDGVLETHVYGVKGGTPSLYVYADLDWVGDNRNHLGEAFLVDGYATVAAASQNDEKIALIASHELYHLVARNDAHPIGTIMDPVISSENTLINGPQRLAARTGAAKLSGITL